MAIMNFMKVGGAPGDSQDAGHKDWLDIEPFQMSASNMGSFAIGAGGNVGGADLHDLSIQAVLDKAMPVMFHKLAFGEVTNEVILEACKMSGKSQITFQKITLTNVYFTGLSTGSGSSANGQPMVTYNMKYEKIKTEYTEVGNDGKKGATTMAGWDAKANKKV